MRNLCIDCGMDIYKSGMADPCICTMCEQTMTEGKTYACFYVL